MSGKRPLGLAKSKKSKSKGSDGGPVAKKQKTNEEENATSSDVSLEDWEDLNELDIRARRAYEQDPVSAIQLLRGIVHESDRISRLCPQPWKLYASVPVSERDAPTALYALYADALVMLGTIIGRVPELAMVDDDEPYERDDWFDAALDIIEKGVERVKEAQAHEESEVQDWRLHLVWARALVLAAECKLGSEFVEGKLEGVLVSEEEALTRRRPQESSPTDLLTLAMPHLEFALKHLPASSSSSKADSSEPVATRSDDDEESAAPLPPPSSDVVLTSFALSLIDIADDLPIRPPRNDRIRWLDKAQELLDRPALSNVSNSDLTKARGKMILTRWTEELSGDFDEESADAANHDDAALARDRLGTALKFFEEARKSRVETRAPSTSQDEVTSEADEEITVLLHETLLLLANVTPEGPERDALYLRLKAEGIDLEDDEDEDMEED